MSKKELSVNQLHKKLKKYILKWKAKLFLWSWRIDFRVSDWIDPKEDAVVGDIVCADTSAKWQYYSGDITFSYLGLKNKDDKFLERLVVHELLHLVVNEMRTDGIDHEERVVSHLSSIVGDMENIL